MWIIKLEHIEYIAVDGEETFFVKRCLTLFLALTTRTRIQIGLSQSEIKS